MEVQITFNYNVEKPFTEKELRDFKAFRSELKSILKKGKLKITEKFKVYAFTIEFCTVEEKNNVSAFLKEKNQIVKIIW